MLLGACKQIVPKGEIFESKNEQGVTINYMVTDADARQIEVVGKFISECMKDIGAEAFEGCENLKEAILPVGLDSLAARTFDGCKSLKEIVLPQGIKELRWASLRHCESLEFQQSTSANS